MFSLTLHADTYPQRRDWRDLPWLDRIGEGLRVRLAARLALRAGRREALVARVDAEEAGLAALDDSARAAVLAELRRQLRRDGFADDALVARAFAVVAFVAPAAADALAPLRAVLDEPGCEAAASAWNGRCVVRVLARDGWPLRRQLSRALRVLRGGSLPRVWQLGGEAA